MGLKKDARTIFNEALKAASPAHVIPNIISLKKKKLHIKDDTYNLKDYKRVFVFGSGKAAIPMALALLEILEDEIHGGFIIADKEGSLGPLTLTKGSHPMPDHDSLDAGECMLSFFKKLKKSDFYIYLLSGGSSAMMESLQPGISLEDLQETNRTLLSNPISIDTINRIRKKISLIKGGGLVAATKAKGVVLVLSDVIGDDLNIIGSAPLFYDKTQNDKDDIPCDLRKKLPKSVQKALHKKSKTKKKRSPKHYIIASNILALQAAKKESKKLGYRTSIITDRLSGLAVDAAKKIIQDALKTNNIKPICRLYGGETTVDVQGNGLGGRNQHMSLYALSILKNSPNIAFLSAGTDGKDGNSKAAGACVDKQSYKFAQKHNMDIMEYLQRFDSYSFFEKTKDMIKTGNTGTNVMDVTLILKI